MRTVTKEGTGLTQIRQCEYEGLTMQNMSEQCCDWCGKQNQYLTKVSVRPADIVICADCMGVMLEVATGFAVQRMLHSWDANRRMGRLIQMGSA